MPRARGGCRALPVGGPRMAIQEARAAPAIGPRSETDLSARQKAVTQVRERRVQIHGANVIPKL